VPTGTVLLRTGIVLLGRFRNRQFATSEQPEFGDEANDPHG